MSDKSSMNVSPIESSSMKSLEGLMDRSRPPQPGKPSTNPFPTFTRHELPNGIPLYIVENHTQPYLSLQLVLRSGAAWDGKIPGLAEFTSSLLMSGAGERSAEELAEEIDYLGAMLDAGAGRDETTVGLGCLSRYLRQGLDLMADVALRPLFAPDEVARERKQAIASLKQNRADASYLASVQFRREVYGASPYGSEIDGTEESLKRITSVECLAHHTAHFTAGNAFFVAAGDIDPAELIAMLSEGFSQWTGSPPVPPAFPDPPENSSLRIVIVDRPGSVQSAIRIGSSGLARRDEDYIALVTANTLLGGYFNSRINNNLRERNGFTYGARSGVEALRMPGSFGVSASVGNDVTARALEEILNELRTITSEPVGEDELTMVKNYIVGAQALQTETPGQVASFVRTIALHDLPADYYRLFPDRVRSLQSDDLLRVAKRVMLPERMLAVVAGDASAIREGLEQVAPVTVVDDRGRELR